MMLGSINENDEIALRVISDIKKGEIIGFNAFNCICPEISRLKVISKKEVKSGEIEYFKILRNIYALDNSSKRLI